MRKDNMLNLNKKQFQKTTFKKNTNKHKKYISVHYVVAYIKTNNFVPNNIHYIYDYSEGNKILHKRI